MKTIAKCLAPLLVSLFTWSAQAERVSISADEVLLLSSASSKGVSHYVVNKSDLGDIPAWSGEGEPPLSNEQVTSLVTGKHRQLYGDIETLVKKVSISSKQTHCNSDYQCPDTLWYYKVKVRGEQRATYVVLLNGEFINPKS